MDFAGADPADHQVAVLDADGNFKRWKFTPEYAAWLQRLGKPEEVEEEVQGEDVTIPVLDFLRYVVELWPAASLDLHRYYGIDVAEPAVWDRPWGWLMTRISSLLDRPDHSVFVDQIRADRKE